MFTSVLKPCLTEKCDEYGYISEDQADFHKGCSTFIGQAFLTGICIQIGLNRFAVGQVSSSKLGGRNGPLTYPPAYSPAQ